MRREVGYVFTELERRILEMFVAGDDHRLEVLRGQLKDATVAERMYSDSGFFTHLAVPATAPRLPAAERLIIDDVHAELVGLDYRVGLILFVNEGALDMLECFGYANDVPRETSDLRRAYYLHPATPRGLTLVESTTKRDLLWALGPRHVVR